MAGNSNIRGARASRAPLERQMAAYDRLPRSVRAALAGAAFNYAPFPLWRWFEAGRYTAKAMVKIISTWDAKQIAKGRNRTLGR